VKRPGANRRRGEMSSHRMAAKAYITACIIRRVTLIAESVESAESAPVHWMQYSNCWRSTIRQLNVTD